MNFFLSSSPHQRVKRKTGEVMRLVVYAAIPGLLAQTYFFGWGAIVHLLIASATAIVTEAVVLELRKKDFEKAIKDCSALLTALLLAISIPPFAPWWVTVIGTFFAIAIVKQLYGGLGFNLFNPAMAAYVMLLISFPVQMTNWSPPALLLRKRRSLCVKRRTNICWRKVIIWRHFIRSTHRHCPLPCNRHNSYLITTTKRTIYTTPLN